MNIEAYIRSGILELYVLGLASPEEIKEVEDLASKHPEIQQEINEIRQALESYTLAHQVQPPAALKAKTLERLENTPIQKPKTTSTSNDKPVLQEPPSTPKLTALAIGALILALIGACIAAFLFFRQANTERQNISNLQSQLEQLKKDCEAQKNQLQLIATQFNHIRHWATKPVQMRGTKLSESSLAIVYWNEVKRFAYLDVVALPEAPSNKQYQLWAIVNGKPTDMGVFDLTAPGGGLQSVPFVENPQAFAVTLEPKGGSPVPSLDQMYVIGNIAKG